MHYFFYIFFWILDVGTLLYSELELDHCVSRPLKREMFLSLIYEHRTYAWHRTICCYEFPKKIVDIFCEKCFDNFGPLIICIVSMISVDLWPKCRINSSFNKKDEYIFIILKRLKMINFVFEGTWNHFMRHIQ